jgi:hypothetical protein
MTTFVKPGESVKALLRMLNVGGPKAKVDVFVTYSAKTMNGDLINERSDTFAVVDTKERELDLRLPEGIEPGMYTFEAFVSYTGREALSTDTFEVTGEAAGTQGVGDYMIYIVIIVLFAVIVLLYFRLGRKVSKIEHSSPTNHHTQKRGKIMEILSRLISEKAGRPPLPNLNYFSPFPHRLSLLILTISIRSFKKGGIKWYMPSI